MLAGLQHLGVKRAFIGLICLVSLQPMMAVRALAAPPSAKSMQALLIASQKQLDARNYERASELYLEIWHLDPTGVIALYNAARAMQLSGNIDKAAPLYQEFLALAEVPRELRTKAQTQMAVVQKKQAELRMTDAEEADSAGQFNIAVSLWQQAVALDGAQTDWLRRLGRSLQLADRKEESLAAYDKYLATPAAIGAERAQVAGWRAQLILDGVRDPNLPIESVSKAHNGAGGVVLPIMTFGTGLVIAGIGGAMLYTADQARNALDAQTWGAASQGSEITLSYADAQSRAQAIADKRTVATSALVSGGALALAGGIWWFLRASDDAPRLALAPLVGGAQVTLQAGW